MFVGFTNNIEYPFAIFQEFSRRTIPPHGGPDFPSPGGKIYLVMYSLVLFAAPPPRTGSPDLT